LAFAKNWIVGVFVLLSLEQIVLAIRLGSFAPAKQGGAFTAPRFALDVAVHAPPYLASGL
jgi:hypothetical protein